MIRIEIPHSYPCPPGGDKNDMGFFGRRGEGVLCVFEFEYIVEVLLPDRQPGLCSEIALLMENSQKKWAWRLARSLVVIRLASHVLCRIVPALTAVLGEPNC